MRVRRKKDLLLRCRCLLEIPRLTYVFVLSHSLCHSWSASSKSLSKEGNVDENDYWYLGSVPLPLPNVAFALYGVKKIQTQSRLKRGRPGCNSRTYINSFYTTSGFTAFTGSLYAAGVDGFSTYAGNNNNNGNNNGMLSATCNNGYGVACSSEHGFVYSQYSDAQVCDSKYFVAVVDELDDLNSKLEATDCFQIYDADTAAQNNNNGNGQNNQNYSPVQMLLTYSESCSSQDPSGACPDPHDHLKDNEAQLLSAYSYESSVTRDQRRLIGSFVMFGVAALMLAVTAIITLCCEARQQHQEIKRSSPLTRIRTKLAKARRRPKDLDDSSTGTGETSVIKTKPAKAPRQSKDRDDSTAGPGELSGIQTKHAKAQRGSKDRDDSTAGPGESSVIDMVQRSTASAVEAFMPPPVSPPVSPTCKPSLWAKAKTRLQRSRSFGASNSNVEVALSPGDARRIGARITS